MKFGGILSLKYFFSFRKYCFLNTACISLLCCVPEGEEFHTQITRELTGKNSILPSLSRTGHLDPCPNTFCCSMAMVNSEVLMFASWLVSSAILHLNYKMQCLFTSECLKMFLMLGKRHLPHRLRKDINCSIICNILKYLHLLKSQRD